MEAHDMEAHDLIIGNKYVPHSKGIGDDLPNSNVWNTRGGKEQGSLLCWI